MDDKLLERLTTDKYFGIYTRNGFEWVMDNTYKDSKIYLLDFIGVSDLNKKLGYLEVNKIFKKTFSNLKSIYTIGRAFSGDEIFFQTYDLKDDISIIETTCKINGLSFTYIEDTHRWNKEDVSVILDRMITKLN